MFGATSKHQEAMAAGTNVVTGPEAVVMFLYFLLIKPDQMQLDAITQEGLLGIKEATTLSEYLRQVQLAQNSVFKTAFEQSGPINRIAFPKGYLDIGSEASWIKNAR
jgi:hypothetical protein